MKDRPEGKRRRWLSWLRDLSLLAALAIIVHWWQTHDVVRGSAPPLAGQLIDQKQVALEDYRGHPVLVHFWATWCPVCLVENSSIDALARDYPVLTVATNSGTAQELADYLTEQGLDFPVLPDEAGEVGQAWGVHGVPASFVIDAGGRISFVSVGYTTELGLRMRMWLAAL